MSNYPIPQYTKLSDTTRNIVRYLHNTAYKSINKNNGNGGSGSNGIGPLEIYSIEFDPDVTNFLNLQIFKNYGEQYVINIAGQPTSIYSKSGITGDFKTLLENGGIYNNTFSEKLKDTGEDYDRYELNIPNTSITSLTGDTYDIVIMLGIERTYGAFLYWDVWDGTSFFYNAGNIPSVQPYALYFWRYLKNTETSEYDNTLFMDVRSNSYTLSLMV